MGTIRKATLDDVKKDVAPHLVKQLFQKPFMEERNVTPVCRMLYSKYNNVNITMKANPEGKPYMTIKVKGFLAGGELSYEIKVKGKSIKTKDPLAWIDRVEEFDAFMDDN
ncbi:MAG: hypothetical protein Q4F84_03635 [Fibrobacter sp.]|nr:hypothetical protein [Fibrobacter sp.]